MTRSIDDIIDKLVESPWYEKIYRRAKRRIRNLICKPKPNPTAVQMLANIRKRQNSKT